MKISTRLILGYLLVGLLLGSVSYVGFSTINTIKSGYHDVEEQTVPIIIALHDLRFRSERIATVTSEFVFIITEAEVEGKEVSAEEIAHEELELELAKERYNGALKEYEDFVNRFFPEEKELLENIRSGGEELQKASAELITLKKQGVIGQKVLEKEEEFEEDQKAFLEAIDIALALEEEEFAERRENVESVIHTGRITIIIVGTLAVIIALINGVSIFQSVSKPITKLRDAALEIGRGRLDARVDIKSKDEIGVLAGALNQMADDLSTSTVSKDYFNNIIQSMIDSLIVVDPGGSIKMVNQASLNLLGYEEKELIGKSFDVVFTEEKPSVDYLIKEGRVTNIEKTYLAKDGSRIPVSFSSSIIRAYDGAVQGLVCVAEDITERKQAEEALRESEERHRSLVESLTDAVISIDEDLVITLWNPGAERILGYSGAEVLGKSIEVVVPEKYWESHEKGVKRFLKTGEPKVIGKTVEVEAKSKDGKIIPIELSLSAIKLEGRYTFTGIIRNITERKKAEAELDKRLEELERWHEVTVDREVKMVELKDRIEELEEEIERSKGK